MISAICHRGPDAQGLHIEPEMAMAHARLSIIDLSSGAQPMRNEDATIWITFNGEIFNYVELRNELRTRGHKLRTESDTEVIVHLYEELGPDCVTRLNGDFAFAIWDRRRRQVVLARDRMGVRPLFYTRRGAGLAFASEIKALLKVPGVRAEADPIALDQIFTFWFPLAPRTPFKDILELPPAHLLVARKGNVRLHRYWTLSYPETKDDRGGLVADQAELENELYELFCDATRIRLRADVPVGAYLSGGFDSSATTAAVKELNVGNLRSFSVTFETTEFDESAFQQQMVDALQTEHTSVRCRTSDIARVFPTVVRHAEYPLMRSGPAPMLALSGLVRSQGFKVVLTGEGADEVFAGYDIFKEAKLRRFCARQPQSRRRPQLLRRLYPYLPGLQRQPQRYLEAFFSTREIGDPLFSHMPRFRTTSGARIFFSADLLKELRGYDAMADLRLLPRAIAQRPKQPYRAPDSQSFVGGDAPAYVADCLSKREITASGYFDPVAVDRLLAKARSQPFLGTRDHAAIIGVLSTQLWQRQFIERPASRAFDQPKLSTQDQERLYAIS
jgi:asparagine synthase (glutamine-hydrolysing)